MQVLAFVFVILCMFIRRRKREEPHGKDTATEREARKVRVDELAADVEMTSSEALGKAQASESSVYVPKSCAILSAA